MAKAILTFTDKPNGNVTMTMEFEPAVTDDSRSTAQVMCVIAMKAAKEAAQSFVDGDTDEDI